MRLKEDTSNYRASGLMVRDARHAPDGPEAPRAVRGKKDRKRWCGGRVGREHTPECRKYSDVKRTGLISGKDPYERNRILVCTTCGKELDHYWGSLRSERREPPAWVTS